MTKFDRYMPDDPYPRECARDTNATKLTRDFEIATLSGLSVERENGELEIVAAVAIARVKYLEQQLGARERRVKSVLYPRDSGTVIPFPKKAPATLERPGA